MSLVGNLEELGLAEILQLVGFSKKTGVLTLSSRGRDASICFSQGQIVRAASSSYRQSLGEVLLQKGVIGLAALRKALEQQQEQQFRERLGVILVNSYGISQEIVEEVICSQIENIVYSLFEWSDGRFEFEAAGNVETVDGAEVEFMLNQGLNPKFLAMEGIRILGEKPDVADKGLDDGKLHEVDCTTSTFQAETNAGPESGTNPENDARGLIIIVDDDMPTLRLLAKSLAEYGFKVHPFSRTDQALIELDRIYRGGERPAVLIDLIIPRMDGSGVLGGIELLNLLHNNFKGLKLVAMSDYHYAEAEQKVHEILCPFIIKPGRSEINSPLIMQGFLPQLIDKLQHAEKHQREGAEH